MSDDAVLAAAAVMDEATNGFVLTAYGVEGLNALMAQGWTLTPPDVCPRCGGDTETVLRCCDAHGRAMCASCYAETHGPRSEGGAADREAAVPSAPGSCLSPVESGCVTPPSVTPPVVTAQMLRQEAARLLNSAQLLAARAQQTIGEPVDIGGSRIGEARRLLLEVKDDLNG